ncbi:MAG: spore photoproduct lyase [Chitinophagales bacterium]
MFVPHKVIFEPQALDYPLGQKLFRFFKNKDTPISFTSSHNRVTGIKGKTPQQTYVEAKRTLVVGIRRTEKFQTCRPSAHFQLPLVTSCPGLCEYCYLATTLGSKPYVRVYVNIEEILDWTTRHMEARAPEETIFEGSATSDPVPIEPYTGSLARVIEFFSDQELGRFRFVTKYDDIDTLLSIRHNGRTQIRFSINAPSIINKYEHGTISLESRLNAAYKLGKAGYPIGFLVAPIFTFPGWKEGYGKMFSLLRQSMDPEIPISFEFITHRFTARAKSTIQTVFPHTDLAMNEEERKFKFGQFGYGKYVYPKEVMQEIEEFFRDEANKVAERVSVLYSV